MRILDAFCARFKNWLFSVKEDFDSIASQLFKTCYTVVSVCIAYGMDHASKSIPAAHSWDRIMLNQNDNMRYTRRS